MAQEPEQASVPVEPQQRGRGATVFVAALFALFVVGAAAWFLLKRGEPQAPVAPAIVEAPPPPPPAPKTAPLEGSDVVIRDWARRLSAPLFAPFFEANDLARRVVSVLYNLAEGNSPRQLLAFLKPEGGFEAEQKKGGALFIPAKTFARYDFVASALGAIDVKVAAQAWSALEPIFEAAHQEIAPPGRTVRASLDGAIATLLAVPVVDREVEVVPGKGALFAYKDPALEGLSAAQKHLFRMGPANVRSIKAKLRDLQSSLAPAGK